MRQLLPASASGFNRVCIRTNSVAAQEQPPTPNSTVLNSQPTSAMASSPTATNELFDNANNGSDADNASKVHLKIMSPSPGVPPDLSYHVHPAMTINALKDMITESLESKPPSQQQRLIYRGKILEGAAAVGDALVGQVSCASTKIVGH